VDVVDHVPDWFLAGQRRKPSGRPPGRPRAPRTATSLATDAGTYGRILSRPPGRRL
jgi:hypothetical protein